jgi:hypothetical protein
MVQFAKTVQVDHTMLLNMGASYNVFVREGIR